VTKLSDPQAIQPIVMRVVAIIMAPFFRGDHHCNAAGGRKQVVAADANEENSHLVLGSCMHTPYLARHYQQKMVGSLPRGMPR